MELTGEGKICSFCGEPWGPEPDRRFAGGFGAQICVPCIRRCSEIFESEESYRRARRPAWDEMSDEELLETLPRILATSDQVDEFLRDWVGLIRDRGISWQHVGLALGVSRQAAWERFTRPRAAPRAAPDHSSGQS
jgi:hypothetical protein